MGRAYFCSIFSQELDLFCQVGDDLFCSVRVSGSGGYILSDTCLLSMSDIASGIMNPEQGFQTELLAPLPTR